MKLLILSGLTALSLSVNAQITKHNGHNLKGANEFTSDINTRVYYCSKCKKYVDRHADYNFNPSVNAQNKGLKPDTSKWFASTDIRTSTFKLDTVNYLVISDKVKGELLRVTTKGDIYHLGKNLTTDTAIVNGLKAVFSGKVDSLQREIDKLKKQLDTAKFLNNRLGEITTKEN